MLSYGAGPQGPKRAHRAQLGPEGPGGAEGLPWGPQEPGITGNRAPGFPNRVWVTIHRPVFFIQEYYFLNQKSRKIRKMRKIGQKKLGPANIHTYFWLQKKKLVGGLGPISLGAHAPRQIWFFVDMYIIFIRFLWGLYRQSYKRHEK